MNGWQRMLFAQTLPSDPLYVQRFWMQVIFTLIAWGICIWILKRRWDNPRAREHPIEIIFAASAAAIGAFLITGSALVTFESDLGGTGKFAAQGTAGAAFFLAVLILWRFIEKKHVAPPHYDAAVPGGHSFQTIATSLVQREQANANFVGFTPDELNAVLQQGTLHGATPQSAFEQLRLLSPNQPIRTYQVTVVDGIFTFQV